MRRVFALMAAICTFASSLAHADVATSVAPATIRVGVTPGTHAQIMNEVKRVAATRGLPLDVVVFDDAARIDAALAAGRIDVASFEDATRLEQTCAAHGYALTSVAPTINLPMALYSRRLRSLAQLRPGATIAIPADAPGTSRALVLLQNDTLVTFRDSAGLHATTRDITGNRLHLKIVAVPRERLFKALDSADLVAITSDDAARAGLFPARDSISYEDARSPYADVLAVRDADRSARWVSTLIAAYHSDDVAHFILTRYDDSVRRPW
ncbi:MULTISPECIES: MetQ/NlpA family lipoprotein [unclassified Paraburkholderia]|uniref:MetQ/NlpA family lipoprotein n=1 Tax=unclassified Paraburkholderia TaxID=2615204 RepID=UPI002AB12093|nr:MULTISPECIES: MetQ/NlpA family lipoprotein [unclassified Paraburkholderia]